MAGRNPNNNRAHVISRLDLAKCFLSKSDLLCQGLCGDGHNLGCVPFIAMTTPA